MQLISCYLWINSNLEKWASYFSVAASASATLTGLIFVGVSINLNRILSFVGLPDRALGSIILLINILLVCSFCLIPGQPVFYLGIEILALETVIWIVKAVLDWRSFKKVEKIYRIHSFQGAVFAQLAIIPYFIAGIYLIHSSEKGLYWLIPGISISFINAIVDSWILLIEINR